MTLTSKMEYSKTVANRYLQAKYRKDKTKILDEFCATTRYARKYAITKLRSINFKDPPRKKTRKKLYSAQADTLLIQVWQAFGRICGERLHPYLPEGIVALKRFNHIRLFTVH